jgi:hypothetical protein
MVQLVERAQQAGALRADFTAQDVSLLLWGGHGVIEHTEGTAPEIWRRYLDFVLAGVRGDRSGPRPGTGAS